MANQGGIYSVLDDARINGRQAFFASLGLAFDGSWASMVGGAPVTSNTEIELYRDLGAVPQLAEWIGEAKFGELPNYAGSLRNIEFLAGLLIQKADLRRDKTGIIQRKIADLGARAATHWEKLISTRIIAAETDGSATINSTNDLTSQAYDGQAFFDTDHSFTGGAYTTSQTNDLAVGDYASIGAVSTAAQPTAAEAAAFIPDIIGHFWTLKDSQGEPANGDCRNFLVMVGTNQLFSPISAALGLKTLAAGAESAAYGQVTSLGLNIKCWLNPRLSANTTKVYVFNTDGAGDKPFILQEETPLQIAEDAGTAFDKAIKVGVWGTRNVGFGNWQRAIVATLS